MAWGSSRIRTARSSPVAWASSASANARRGSAAHSTFSARPDKARASSSACRRGKRLPKLRLLLGDDHTLMRHGLRKILEERPEWEVIAEVGDGREADRKSTRLNSSHLVISYAVFCL